ncbi:MAG TPA: PIN domain-containing protein [Verrucomicrobiae bacterium]
MKIAVDTNWLVAAYFIKLDQPRSETVVRFSERCDLPWIVSLPALLEARGVFSFYGGSTASVERKKLQADLGTTLLVASTPWEDIAKKTEELSDRFSTKARLGMVDLMILASALKAEATHFLSFDSNSNLRALASVLKLKVFPELTADDRRRAAALR